MSEPGSLTLPGIDAEEARLVADLRAGSETAFSLLVHRHQRPMLRVAQRYVGSLATAEDVVQETWLAVLLGVDRFDGRSSFKTWMYRILSNRAKTMGQRERRCVPLPSEAGAEAPTTTDAYRSAVVEDHVLASEVVTGVRHAVEDLPPNQRLVMTLRGLACWSAEEVCAELDVSPGNQRVLLHRARSRVRQQLEGSGGRRAATQGAL